MGRGSMRQILVLNAGSSTIKGAFVEVGYSDAECRIRMRVSRTVSLGSDPDAVVAGILDEFARHTRSVDAVAHRVVHGGRHFCSPVVVDAEVEHTLEAIAPLAPLHNPVALGGIRLARERFGECPQVAVFDTAFHADRPVESMQYPLPQALCDRFGLRRFGFHGIAHQALVHRLAVEQGLSTSEVTAVTLQLGSGCSACAVERGRSIETSMGLSPLGGLPMATRSGDLDPGVLLTLLREGWEVASLTRLLTRESGLQGLSGRSSMQDVQAAALAGDASARLAISQFVRAVGMTVGAYLTLLGGEGAIVFSGGIGTNALAIRKRICDALHAWNVELDAELNRTSIAGRISTQASRPVYVFEADEERLIAREAFELIRRERT